MHERERKNSSHLILLSGYTLLMAALTVEALLLGWTKLVILELLVGLAVCWVLHITGKISERARLWVYFVMTMLSYGFYAIHDTSFNDAALVMTAIILVYFTAEIYDFINYCVAVYVSTMLYDIFVVPDIVFTPDALSVSRLIFDFAVVFMAGYLVKVAVRKRSSREKSITREMKRLEEINLRTEDFLTNVSHELRTPVNVVTGLTAVMLKKEDDAGKRKDIVSLQRAGYRLFNQIEDILDYTEIDTNRIRVESEVYMVSSVINDIAANCHLEDNENHIEMIFDVDAAIPSVLIGDGRKIKKIIQHLVDNAVKFTKKGGVYVHIYALPKAYGVNLCINVCDTGVGISEENIGKITEKFYQSNSGRNRTAGGLGLGIPIVSGMASAMGGFMQIESKEGVGTSVLVSIPQKVENDARSMSVDDKSQMCLACYLKADKYEVAAVRNYYNTMISNMAHGLEVTVHRVFDMEELEKLMSVYQLTHLFIGTDEYNENASYFEYLDKSVSVVVVADSSFELPGGSRAKLLRKPFCSLMVAEILNAKAADNSESAENDKNLHMICPDIKALVVDDEPMNLMVAEGILGEYRMNVRTAHSGMEAIEICSQEEFDLIFLDHMMPEMDGVETLKQLRRLNTNVEHPFLVIAFTANAVSGAKEMFFSEGFDGFLSKPIETSELERVLRKLLPKASVQYVSPDSGESEAKKPDKSDDGGKAEKINDAPAEGAADNTVDNAAATNINNEASETGQASPLEAAGIDTATGLEYCQGMEDLYNQVLIEFAQSEKKNKKEISDYKESGDLDNYRIRVHALKSTSKTIGAMELSELARLAGAAAKKGDAEYINSHNEELLEKYEETARGIGRAFGLDEEPEPPALDNEPKGDEITKDELIRQLTELEQSLGTYEADKAEKIIGRLSQCAYQGTSAGEMLGGIKKDVEDFEMAAAAEKTKELVNQLKGGEKL